MASLTVLEIEDPGSIPGGEYNNSFFSCSFPSYIDKALISGNNDGNNSNNNVNDYNDNNNNNRNNDNTKQ